MVRTVLIPDSKNISIQVPENFVGKQVEVIAFTIDSPIEQNLYDKPVTHYASVEALAKDWSNPVEDEAWQDL